MPGSIVEETVSPPKTRTYRTKSHRGCTNCKSIRRKCGEERPTCSYCLKDGKECVYDFDSLIRFKAYNPASIKQKLDNKALSKGIRRKSAPESSSPRKDVQITLEDLTLPRRSSLPSPPSDEPPSDPSDPLTSVIALSEGVVDISTYQIFRPPSLFADAVASTDLPYLQYFLSEMPRVHPYSVVFPQFIPDLMAVANSTPHLRHSMISLAAVIADTSLRRPLVRALLHHQETLRKVQDLLSTGGIEETTVYAVMMLAYFNVFSGRFLSARRHLRGFSILLDQYSKGTQFPSTTMMLIWRCAVRLDYFVSSVYPCKPIFPAPPVEQEEFHRGWIHAAVDPSGEEWAMAQFALDNLQSRAAHLSWTAYQTRRFGVPDEIAIQEQCSQLLNDFTVWRAQKVMVDEDALEELVELYRPSESVGTFVGHPPMNTRNRFYTNLLNEFRASVLFITFIAFPVIATPSPYDDVRRRQAIDLCRSIAATGISLFPMPIVRILQLAGLVFNDPIEYPEECTWIESQLQQVADRGILAASRVKEMLLVVWNSTFPWTYEDTERLMQNEDDLDQLDREAEVYEEDASPAGSSLKSPETYEEI